MAMAYLNSNKAAFEIAMSSPSDQNQTPENDLHLGDIFRASTVETAIQALQSIIQFHFQKTLEKKRAIDSQKKEVWKLFSWFFIFLAIIFVGTVNSSRLECKHCWAPTALCFLGHAMLYVSTVQTLRCLNGLKFQRHCHKLTLGLAAGKLKKLQSLPGSVISVPNEAFEVPYQEPPAAYYSKFRRRWALYTAFMLVTMCTMAAAIATILCF